MAAESARPVDDLLYGRIAIDAGLRENRNIVTIPFVRAVCRTRITMIPQTVEDQVVEEGGTTRAASSIIPSPEDFKFHLYGTRSGVDYNNKANADEVVLEPQCYYEESTRKCAHTLVRFFFFRRKVSESECVYS